MSKHSDKYSDGPANEAAMQKWLIHLLRDWVRGSTDKAAMRERYMTLMRNLRTESSKKYANRRIIELMKDVDRGMVELYDMIHLK